MSVESLVHQLGRIWTTNDGKERRRLLLEIARPDAAFLSPHGASHGVEAYAVGIDIFRKSFPKSQTVHGKPEEHHRFVRFPWSTIWNDGRPPTDGVDFGEMDESGRLVRLVSFTEPSKT